MKPLSIEINNFLPFVGQSFLDLSTIHAATISGPNGAGKSSLLIDSILFALFGKARKRPEDLINDIEDSMSVSLKFFHNNETFIVERGIKRGKNQTLKLIAGDKDISERLLTNTQKKLDDILGFSYQLLLSTAIAQQEEINLLSTMTPGDREKVLSEMLSIEHWEIKKKKIGEILNEHKDLNKNIIEKETELSLTNELITENSNSIKTKENSLLPVKITHEMLTVGIKKLEENLKEYDKHKNLLNTKAIIKSQLNSLQGQLDDYPDSDPEIDNRISLIEIKKHENNDLEVEIDSEKKILSNKLNELQTELNKINSLQQLTSQTQILQDVPCVGLNIHDSCKLLSNALSTKKTIENFISTSNFDNLDSILVSKTSDKLKLQEQIKFFDESKQKIQKENADLRVQLSEENTRKSQIEKRIILQEKYDKLLIDFNDIESKTKVIPNFNQEEYRISRTHLDSLTKEIQLLEIDLTRLHTQLESIQKSQQKLKDEIEKLKEVENNLANYRTLYTAYNEIPSLLFEEAIPFIEDYTNEILEKIAPERRVQLRSFKETKSNTQQKALDVIGTTSTGTRDFDNLSGSEKFRQSLALRIALARYNSERNNAQINFFIVDEGFGSLDEENVYMMKTMLKDIASRFELFLMISHVPELRDVFDTQIIVNPEGKGKRITIL